MKVEKNFKRKIMLLGIFTLLLTSCGGGGGGGGGGSSNLPIKPSIPSIPGKPSIPGVPGKPNTPSPSIPGNFTKLNKSDMNELKNNLENNRKMATAIIPRDSKILNGSQVKVAILDSDFITEKAILETRYPGIEIVPRVKNSSNNPHGREVLEVLMDTNESRSNSKMKFKVIAGSVGSGGTDSTSSNYGKISPNLETYNKVFNKFDANQKVKVINQSFGGDRTIEESPYNELSIRNVKFEGDGQAFIPFFENAVNNGGLFVWAAGNRKNNPDGPMNSVSEEAGLPRFAKNLEKGWIAVIGVQPEEMEYYMEGGVKKAKKKVNGLLNIHEPDHLAYAGDKAKYWSISADNRAVPNSGSYGIGSSYAAPRVSRAAALVAEKFDWMTPDQVRQTLFTTTDNTKYNIALYGKGEDDIRNIKSYPTKEYGWGMLNQDRALKGPGAFINTSSDFFGSDDFTANIPSGKISYFENKILGSGGLIKNGLRTIHLTNDNSYFGGSIVNAGTLEIHKIHSSEVTVKSAGRLVLQPKTLIGYKELSSNLIETIDPQKISVNTPLNNYGNVEVNGTTAIVGGDYTAYKGSTTTFNKGAKLNVLGNIKIENGTVKVLSDKYVTQGEKSTLMEGKAFEGNIANVEVNGMRVASVEANDGKLVAELTRQSPVEYLGENAEESSKNVAQNVENVFVDLDEKVKAGTASQEELAMAATMQTMSVSTFSAATEKMSGEIYASAQALTFSQAQNINRDLSNRLAGLDNLKLSNGEIQAWFSAIGSDGKLRREGYASADTRVTGGQFGLDKKYNNTNLGIALAYSHAKADFNRYAGNSKSDMVGISLYGKQELANNFYTAGRIGISHVSTKVERELIDGTGNTVQGRVKHDDIMSSVYLEVGKNFKWLTPFVGYSQDYLRRGSFSESNAAWGIHADSKNYWNSNFLVGLRAEFALNKYKFQSYITQAINVGKRDLAYEGHFTGSTVKQKYQGVKQAKNTTWIGLGVFRELTPNFGIYGNMDFRVEDGKRADSVFSAGLQYKF